MHAMTIGIVHFMTTLIYYKIFKIMQVINFRIRGDRQLQHQPKKNDES